MFETNCGMTEYWQRQRNNLEMTGKTQSEGPSKMRESFTAGLIQVVNKEYLTGKALRKSTLFL